MSFGMEDLKKALDSSSTSPPLESLDIKGIAKYIKAGKAKNIITAVGAGISTSAGIPDFRSPNTGIYSTLGEFDLDNPMDVFDIDFFRENPKPFFEVARRLHRPEAKPTIAHYFIKLLQEKGLLLRDYTQNCDQLERISGLPENKMIEAHGSFYTGHCMKCRTKYHFDQFSEAILNQKVPRCSTGSCKGVVKPDIVFFGEDLPPSFYTGVPRDFPKCDLLIIMGTSLLVSPFNKIIDDVRPGVPRLYINRELKKSVASALSFLWGKPENLADVFVQGDADDVCLKLAELLGWKDDLLKLQAKRNAELDRKYEQARKEKENK